MNCGRLSEYVLCTECNEKLSKNQYRSLNEIFYESFPQGVFTTSMTLAINCLARAEKMAESMEEEASYKKFTVGWSQEDRIEHINGLKLK